MSYCKEYGERGCENGFRCKRCKRIRIPYETSGKFLDEEYYEKIRLEGIKFDESLL